MDIFSNVIACFISKNLSKSKSTPKTWVEFNARNATKDIILPRYNHKMSNAKVIRF